MNTGTTQLFPFAEATMTAILLQPTPPLGKQPVGLQRGCVVMPSGKWYLGEVSTGHLIGGHC